MRLYAGGKTRGSRSPEPHKAELNRCRRLPQLSVQEILNKKSWHSSAKRLAKQRPEKGESCSCETDRVPPPDYPNLSSSVHQAEWPHFVFTCHFTWEAGCVVAFRYLSGYTPRSRSLEGSDLGHEDCANACPSCANHSYLYTGARRRMHRQP